MFETRLKFVAVEGPYWTHRGLLYVADKNTCHYSNNKTVVIVIAVLAVFSSKRKGSEPYNARDAQLLAAEPVDIKNVFENDGFVDKPSTGTNDNDAEVPAESSVCSNAKSLVSGSGDM